jgi:polysaccharide deacetylase 2 family uncharacterized protein YibQ
MDRQQPGRIVLLERIEGGPGRLMPFRRPNKLWTRLTTSSWTPVILTVLVVGLLIVVFDLQKDATTEKSGTAPLNGFYSARAGALRDSAITAGRRVLNGYGLPFRIQKQARPRGETWTVSVPAEMALPSIHLSLQEEMNRIGAAILNAETDPATGNTLLKIGDDDSCYYQIRLIPLKKEENDAGKIALVIDDFGDRLDDMEYAFFDLDGKITVSVLPGRKFSAKVAREANERGREVILHLAMEPLQAAFREDGFIILTKMPRERIRSTFQKALNQVPSAVGVNNHMGSRATSDRQTMTDVMECIRQKGLYFVDSYTVASSVAYTVAREMGVPTARRDVFLDVDGSEASIRRKLGELALKAKRNGRAVGIGHCHRNMLSALQKEMPRIQEQGLKFVSLSAVVELTTNEGE